MKTTNVLLAFVVTFCAGCTVNLTIETDYASQNGGGGDINEEVTAETTTTPTVDTQLEVPGEVL